MKGNSYFVLDLVQVLLDDQGNVSSGLEVPIESTLESPFTQKIQGMSLEDSIFASHTHKNSKTPALQAWQFWITIDTQLML